MCSGISLFLIACQHLGHDGHYEGYRMANSRLCETARPWFQNMRPKIKRFYQFRARGFTSKKYFPEALSDENFEIMTQVKLNKMTENSKGSLRKTTKIILCLVLLSESTRLSSISYTRDL